MSVENYIPLPEASTQRIRATLTLPYHMEEEIGLNVKRTEFLCQLGGIEFISIKNNNDRPTPVIVGFTNQGTAMAGFSATESISKYQNIDKSKGLPYSASWSALDVSINNDEIRFKLDIEKKDSKDPGNWSKIIDRSLKESITSASFQNLVKRKAAHMGFSIFFNMVPTSFILHHTLSKDMLSTVLTFFNWQIIAKIFDFYKYGLEEPGRGKRWSTSLYEFPELDRKFLLDCMIPFSSLTKKIDK